MQKMIFPFVKQKESMTCGVACLQMICSFFGKKFDQNFLLNICHATTEGVSLLGIKESAEKHPNVKCPYTK